jgi:hypothetical protein
MILRLSRHLQNRTEAQITHFLLLVTDLDSEGGSSWKTCGEDVIAISICSGGAIIKISAAERPKFILGQLIIVGAMFVVTLVELILWLAN